MENKAVRSVKVYSKYRCTGKRWISEGRQVPWLTVSGLWLEQAGFQIGDRLRITIANDTLIITKEAGHGDQND